MTMHQHATDIATAEFRSDAKTHDASLALVTLWGTVGLVVTMALLRLDWSAFDVLHLLG